VQRLNRANRFDVQPWQTPGLLARAGLTAAQAIEAAWFVDCAGRQHRGAAAINAALAEIGGVFKPIAALYRLPGLRQLEDAIYRWVAENRYRLPGSSPTCAVPPENKQ
jgi:predicted DCC family thiol-disulfide oxidoreductase YuxK